MSTPPPAKIGHVLESCLYVKNLAAAERFYTEVLGLTLHSRHDGRHLFFRCGNRMVLVFNPVEAVRNSTQGDVSIPPHGAIGSGHLCFAMRDADLDAWSAHLKEHGVNVERVIDWPGGGRSLYFRDPAGNSLELATPRIWEVGEETLADPATGSC